MCCFGSTAATPQKGELSRKKKKTGEDMTGSQDTPQLLKPIVGIVDPCYEGPDQHLAACDRQNMNGIEWIYILRYRTCDR